jgi:hypothetical protein
MASGKDRKVRYEANNKARLVTRGPADVNSFTTGWMHAVGCAIRPSV